jgi:predicted GIY-YIG superfamily endonuclease
VSGANERVTKGRRLWTKKVLSTICLSPLATRGEDADAMEMAWVYLLQCADGTFYVGSTRDLEQRLEQHSTSKVGFTSRRRPLTLAWCAELDLADAYAIERRLHGWSRRKKQALIDGDIDLLKMLAKRGVQGDGGPS